MKVFLSPFIRDLFTYDNSFSSYDFNGKYSSLLLKLFAVLKLIKFVGSRHRAIVYEKNDKFSLQFQEIRSEEILQLIIVLLILDIKKIPPFEYNGKIYKTIFKHSSKIVSYILFQTGMIHKERNTYQYTPFFHHLSKLSKNERKTLITSLKSHYNKLEQNLYLSSSRSLRHKPDFVSVSFDHGISLKTKWVLKYWKANNKKDNQQFLEKLAKENKQLIMFESSRKTQEAKAFITIFPRLEN